MNRLAKTVLVTILVMIAASSLWAASAEHFAVIRLAAYIPGSTTSTRYDEDFTMEANAYNFSYSMQQVARTKIFLVMAI
ncbi:MAG: hypothetical protein EOM68_04035 [Spirochaetia bacterium]|nr:hypothetical protein [Spirochaetia bacterium]